MFTSLWAQSETMYTKLDSCMLVYRDAVLSEDIDQLIALTHPNIIKLAGGQEFVHNSFLEDTKMYHEMQLRLDKMQTKGESKIIKSGEELHALVPYVKEFITVDGSNYKEENFYLAASVDMGMTWTFVDMKKYDSESIRVFVPEYNGRLDIFLNLNN